jgi:hypothetical protein
VHDNLIGHIPQDVDEDGNWTIQILESQTTMIALKAYETLARDVGKVQNPVHAIELRVPLTDLGDATFVVGTIVLPPLDVQLAEDIGGNSIDVGGRDTVRGKKGLDWSGHCMKFKKVWTKLIRFT